jgi:hypothetical protein
VQLAFQLAAAIAAHVMTDIVSPAPECWMLRDCHEESSTGNERSERLAYYCLVLGDVLEYVEGTDQVESRTCGDHPRVHLHKIRAIPEAPAGVDQSGGMNFRTEETRPRSGVRHGCKDRTGSAPDFQITCCLGKKAIGETHKEATARLEPEVSAFATGKPLECRRIETAWRIRQ